MWVYFLFIKRSAIKLPTFRAENVSLNNMYPPTDNEYLCNELIKKHQGNDNLYINEKCKVNWLFA